MPAKIPAHRRRVIKTILSYPYKQEKSHFKQPVDASRFAGKYLLLSLTQILHSRCSDIAEKAETKTLKVAVDFVKLKKTKPFKQQPCSAQSIKPDEIVDANHPTGRNRLNTPKIV